MRDVSYDGISKPRRVELHKRIGCSLEKLLPDNSLLGALSWNFFQAQDKEKCIKYSILAGEHFLREAIFPEAIDQYKRALDAIPEDHNHDSKLLKALEGLGDAFHDSGSCLESSKYYDRFLKKSIVPKDVARIQMKQAENWSPFALGNGDASHSLSLLDQAESCPDLGLDEIANIELVRANEYFDLGEIEKSAISLKRANDLMVSNGKEWKNWEPIMLDYYIARKRLLHDEVFDKAKILYEKAKESGDMKYQIYAERTMADAYVFIDRKDLALVHFRKCAEMADRSGDFMHLMICHRFISDIEDELGNFSIAKSEAKKALNASNVTNESYQITWLYALLGRVCLHNDEIEEAKDCSIKGWGYLEQTAGSIRAECEGDWYWSKAELELALGNYSEGFNSFEKAITNFEEAGSFFWYPSARCRYIYAQALIERGLKTQAKEQLDKAFERLTKLNRLTLRNKVEEMRASL